MRRVWYGLMWFMRRPFLKRIRLGFTSRVKGQALESYRQQERFARRHGLAMTRVIVWLVVGILLAQILGAFVLYLQVNGGFSPDHID
ncbi:MAG: hypothetical protein JNK63_07285 [Chthonomonas sp.]|nr:hypothetical protein [Chthonomonas sp.]